ncbi:hypothetical protein [Streptomyces anulatus]|uniref:hypothetical protein n=1 Tax=Streptomyces anulatus TaxID=1892 RepID=UPI001674DCBA|nr:hypothetical protein [Streptomyces anulatus]GGY78384.1 hypothetical protein GCM10010342_77440 [Streptomyces anulatus]
MAQRENPRPSLVSSCLDLLESLTLASDRLSKMLRGAAKAGRDTQAAHTSLRDVSVRVKELWSSILALFSNNGGTAQPC